MAKRVFDIFFSALGLVLLCPFFFLIALLVKLDDRGAVFYRQIRIGRGGIPFEIVKFRTMRADADRMGPSITTGGDARVTKVGLWLRKSKIDELPQLWNVLRGEMSFVGPRPEVPKYVALYTLKQREVLEMRPGITDEASLEFRDEESLLASTSDAERYYVEHCIPRKIALNLAYGSRANIFRDVMVIFRTIGSVWFRR